MPDLADTEADFNSSICTIVEELRSLARSQECGEFKANLMSRLDLIGSKASALNEICIEERRQKDVLIDGLLSQYGLSEVIDSDDNFVTVEILIDHLQKYCLIPHADPVLDQAIHSIDKIRYCRDLKKARALAESAMEQYLSVRHAETAAKHVAASFAEERRRNSIELPPLPYPECVYADLSLPAYTAQQMTEYGRAVALRPPVLPISFHHQANDILMSSLKSELMDDETGCQDRFIEAVLSALHACRYPMNRLDDIIEGVYERPPGVVENEIGGLMLMLAGWCRARGNDMQAIGDAELDRLRRNPAELREKYGVAPDWD